jgi:hypothetical protein
LPVRDRKELIAWLKANPNQATMAHVGAGSGARLRSFQAEDRHPRPLRAVRAGAFHDGPDGQQVDLFAERLRRCWSISVPAG